MTEIKRGGEQGAQEAHQEHPEHAEHLAPHEEIERPTNIVASDTSD